MEHPLISVVIPSRNRPQLVYRAVESVLSQTFTDFEVVVVIDGPDAESCTVLSKITDMRLQVIELPRHVGGSEARNTGVHAARGQWIALLDDDDEWMPKKLEQQFGVASRSEYTFPIVATSLTARSPRADFLWPRKPPRYPLSEYLFVRSSLFQGEGVVQTSTLMMPRELLLRVPFTPGLRRHQDWDWILRASSFPGAGVEFIPEPLAIWHIDGPDSPLKTQYDWRYSVEWIRANRTLVTPRAYSAFMAVTVSSQAAWQNDWTAFFPVLWETLFAGSPRPMDIGLFLSMWFLPRKLRQFLRAAVTHVRMPRISPPVSLEGTEEGTDAL